MRVDMRVAEGCTSFDDRLMTLSSPSPSPSGTRPHSDACLLTSQVTIICPGAEVGATGEVDGVTYTKRDRAGLDALVREESRWDQLGTSCTSRITNMSSIFYNADAFNQDIGGWDTSSVTDMIWMFRNADAFNQNLTYWDVDSVLACYAFSSGASSWTAPQPAFTQCVP